ncbi:MAG: GNAT family N-acetyltransferase [Cyanobacteria bacterium P01_C01_bin.38]
MSTITITNLTTKDTKKIIEIFSDGFEDYPLMEYFFGDAYKQSIKHLIQFTCDRASEGNGLLLGAFVEGNLQGVASIAPPQNDQKVEKTATSLEEKFATAIGEEALMRIEKYSELKKANKPASPHFYINTLAVIPQNQGKGIGSAILSHIHQMSEQDSDSHGVALDTQTQQNVDYYQRFGYEVSATAKLENVNNWFMFRRNN